MRRRPSLTPQRQWRVACVCGLPMQLVIHVGSNDDLLPDADAALTLPGTAATAATRGGSTRLST